MLAGVLAGLAALTAGLLTPAIRITQFRLWDTVYSIVGGLEVLWQDRQWLLFIVIVLFSVAFPYVKLLVLGWLWLLPRGPRDGRVLAMLDTLGRWSMLDVLVVALAVVSVQSSFFIASRLETGIYYFAAAAVASMLLVAITRRLAQRG
jgi:paraquat-inducible protein A